MLWRIQKGQKKIGGTRRGREELKRRQEGWDEELRKLEKTRRIGEELKAKKRQEGKMRN